MAFIEVRAASGPRVQVFELHTNEACIGRDATCDLQIFESSLAPVHARLLVRRGQIILAPAPGCMKGIRLSDNISRSPIVLKERDVFELGRVTFAARYIDAESPLGTAMDSYQVIRVLESEANSVRRYLARSQDGEIVEITIVEAHVEASEAKQWLGQIERCQGRNAYLREIVGSGYFFRRPYCIERIGMNAAASELGRGLRLSQIDRVVYSDILCLPVEGIVAILAQVAHGLAELHTTWGPHGALEPRTIHLSEGGAVHLIRPGPNVHDRTTEIKPIRSGDGSDHPAGVHRLREVHQGARGGLLDPTYSFLAPERRMGLAASVEDDLWALGVLARHLLGRRPRSDWPNALDDLLVPARNSTPEERGQNIEALGERLRDEAYRQGMDPSVSHISRLVRLFATDLSGPLGLSKWTKEARLDATRASDA